MTVRLNITMDEKLYRRLKQELPAKRISWFIEESVRSRLRPDRKALDAAYATARKEAWGRDLGDDWAATETEGWPK